MREQYLVRNGDFYEGQRVLLNAMDGPPYMDGNVHRLEMLIELSHAFACVGDFQQSGDILDDALADSARREERWCVAELLRMKGEMLLSADPPDSETRAEEVFLQSLDWARRQGALSWELRTASSSRGFAVGKAGVARPAPVLNRFTAGSRRVSTPATSSRPGNC